MTNQYPPPDASMDGSGDAFGETAIKFIHFTYPPLVFIYFLISLTITICTLQTQKLRARDAKVRRNVMLGLVVLVAAIYLSEFTISMVESFTAGDHDRTTRHRNVYLLASAIIFGSQAVALVDTQSPVWHPYYGTWIFGAVVEITLVAGSNLLRSPKSPFDFVYLVTQVLRACTFLTLLALYFVPWNDSRNSDNTDAERQSLLGKKLSPGETGPGDSNGYGATQDTNGTDSETAAEDTEEEDSWLAEQRKAKEKIAKRLREDGNWFNYAKGFAVFLPHIWPTKNKSLQFRAFLVGLCLLAGNLSNVLIPTQMGKVIDSLQKTQSEQCLTGKASDGSVSTCTSAYWPVLVYAILRFVSGSACIGWLKKWLWLPLEQYAYDSLSTASHAHIMSLSSDFHDSKTSSDLTQAVNGGRSVSSLLETVCFQVVPMFIDLACAFTYLWFFYGPYMGLLMGTTVISYLYLSTKLIASRAERRRKYVTVYRKEWTIGQQSLDGWNTASLFNMIPYERTKYASAVKEHMGAKKTYEMSTQATGAAQGLLMTGGLLGALFLGVYQVTNKEQTVGSFTTLLIYWAQLQGPLVFFSNIYRTISYSLMDAEKLLELFQTKPSITDLPNAKPLILSKGEIKFDRVTFAYDERKPTLKNVTFTVPAGKTVALVGETGGGKSTMLKLLDRFYDCKGGSITIDGQDIRNVQLSSLRENIGVVPQDPMLFNDTIMNNIRYARILATDKEVYEACKAAAVHDKIMSFPDGYNSKVGDRGVKLSGGEKQRVAIARAILKKPEIILLDEATSAVDTETEQLIQEGFNTLCRGRTTFIVAHRLSTIMKADHIIVVMNGEVVESGSHQDLVHSKGKYHDLWSKQLFVTPDTERGRSKSPMKGEAHIINDLTSETQKTPLVKVMRDIESKSSTMQPETPTSSTLQAESSDNTTTPINKNQKSEQKNQGSNLKPEAPEFMPATLEHSSMIIPLAKGKVIDDTNTQKKTEQEECGPASLSSAEKSSQTSPAKEVESTNFPQSIEDILTFQETSEPQPAPGVEEVQSAGPFPTNSIPKDELPAGMERHKIKRRGNPRRSISKSEPTNQATHGSALDGAVDAKIVDDVVQGAQGLGGPAMRRVSAPGDPPGTAGPRGPKKRHRNWRLKNRGENSSSSGSGAGAGSGSASREMDGDISTSVPSSAEMKKVDGKDVVDVVDVKAKTVPSSSVHVRFAPDS